jgi:hypothetical protein
MAYHTLREALKETHLYTDNVLYAIVHLPHADLPAALAVLNECTDPFTALLVDKDEVTYVLPTDHVHDIFSSGAQISPGWRLITFDVVLEHDLVGFMAAVSAELAGAGVSIFALSAFERDHILVRQAQFATAWSTLSALCSTDQPPK